MSLFSTASTKFHTEFNEENSELPFVVLIGWISSSKKHLKVYADFYQRNKIDCIYFTPPDSYHPYPAWMEGVAKELLEFIEKTPKFVNRKVFFHAFSGNALTYSYIVKNMTKEFSELVLGAIFDSSPAHITFENAYLSVTQTSNSCIFNNLAYAFLWLTGCILDVPEIDKNYFERLQDPKTNYPQLYLYSEDDNLTPAKYIEEWINEEKKRVMVKAKKWSKSKHVQHFRIHKEEYSKEVLSFISFCKDHQRSRL
eukprot:gene1357-11439_t